MADDNPFTVKLGRIMSPGGTGRFVSFAGVYAAPLKSWGVRARADRVQMPSPSRVFRAASS